MGAEELEAGERCVREVEGAIAVSLEKSVESSIGDGREAVDGMRMAKIVPDGEDEFVGQRQKLSCHVRFRREHFVK